MKREIMYTLTILLFMAASNLLVGCGGIEQQAETAKALLNDNTAESSAQKTVAHTAAEPETVDAEAPATEEVKTVEAKPNGVTTQSIEALSPEQERLNQMGVDYFLVSVDETTLTLYVREQDQALADAAIADLKVIENNLILWNLLLRPNDEILTSHGFQAPPPAVSAIIEGRGITDYEIVDHVIYVDESWIGEARLAATILNVFYPDFVWTAEVREEE